jgi:hypothetical protein
MIQLTLNTGHTTELPRHDVRDDLLPLVRPLLEPGEHELRWFNPVVRLVVPVHTVGWLGTIYATEAPLTTIGIAADDRDAEVVWPALEALYLNLTDRGPVVGVDWLAPHRPDRTPWVASVIVGAMSPGLAFTVADLERCLAWAFVELRLGQSY